DDVREDRAGPELEVAVPLVEDREPGHVRRLQVGRALDARLRRSVDGGRDRARENGLGRPGDVLEEHVTAADQRGEDELDLLALAVDDGLDVVEKTVGDPGRPGETILFEPRRLAWLHPSLRF